MNANMNIGVSKQTNDNIVLFDIVFVACDLDFFFIFNFQFSPCLQWILFLKFRTGNRRGGSFR